MSFHRNRPHTAEIYQQSLNDAALAQLFSRLSLSSTNTRHHSSDASVESATANVSFAKSLSFRIKQMFRRSNSSAAWPRINGNEPEYHHPLNIGQVNLEELQAFTRFLQDNYAHYDAMENVEHDGRSRKVSMELTVSSQRRRSARVHAARITYQRGKQNNQSPKRYPGFISSETAWWEAEEDAASTSSTDSIQYSPAALNNVVTRAVNRSNSVKMYSPSHKTIMPTLEGDCNSPYRHRTGSVSAPDLRQLPHKSSLKDKSRASLTSTRSERRVSWGVRMVRTETCDRYASTTDTIEQISPESSMSPLSGLSADKIRDDSVLFSEENGLKRMITRVQTFFRRRRLSLPKPKRARSKNERTATWIENQQQEQLLLSRSDTCQETLLATSSSTGYATCAELEDENDVMW